MFGGYCMSVTGSSYADNYYYGLDPHDDTDYMTVSGQQLHRQRGPRLICSVYCKQLRGDQQPGPQQQQARHHAPPRVDGAIVEGNTIRGNGDTGLAIFDSYNAVVRNNTIENNGVSAVRLSVGASTT
jgi:parallel beta-helix repeat protein